ncbi:CHASE2 domain-containing protein [Desulfofustis glycolicus]|uniref:Adenylate cyclase n=1 Tax=Desulfofustis glycolicus DSM 9705 TaxID=1121409 RepID=A0A1M5SL88_9BACT|nr:adenylate/guanylate cyclase domain-containing protein [Desulfofustis glycolicus]MCB2215654.1 adenylate/guanylate cyclase domain-containing protein [Desulfobulbaceae bacterium]SHH39377.1 adenylate cyclase [Desulfofustis glycolicus DSM 9705]
MAMNQSGRALVCTVLFTLVGVFLIESPFGQMVEERFGLALLFRLRGVREPPSNVVIVNVDHRSSWMLGLPKQFDRWPRLLFARLLDRLVTAGAAVVVFDIHFAETRDPVNDRVFAESIRRFGRVVLCEKLVRRSGNAGPGSSGQLSAEVDELIPPAPIFADAALARAPFPIPKIPVRVSRSWTFKSSAGGIPTLPVVALQVMALEDYEHLYRVLRLLVPDCAATVPSDGSEVPNTIGLVDTMRRIRSLCLQFSESGRDAAGRIEQTVRLLPAPRQQQLRGLLAAYLGENSIHIDFYGPPATIPTFSYHDILADRNLDDPRIGALIKDSVVFVGAAGTSWSEQQDGFYTVFSQADGLDLSGVELAATVFANLSENRPVRQVSTATGSGLTLAAALTGSLACFLLPPLPAALLLVGCGASYLMVVAAWFSLAGAWSPIVVPLAVLLPGVFLAAMVTRYLGARREREHIEKAFRLYLPDAVVQELSRDLSFITTGDRTVYGVCLLSDAKNYTALSEQLTPTELSALMKRYFEQLFRQVNEQEGLVCNIVGDAMFALWPSAGPQRALKEKACRAAVQIQTAVQRFNREHSDRQLPTRVGLHAGYLLMGNIGAEGHFEYAPVGDIVNTASRIEGLNKYLGTWLIASREVVEGGDGIDSRYLGRFLLGGKSKSVSVFELLPPGELCGKRRLLITEIFPEGLELFLQGRWQDAAAVFEQACALDSKDGPSQFYLRRCALYRQDSPPEDWEGVIRLEK